ncbi:hypothetical protein D3C71_1090550 [compost metagenome]
MRGKLPIQRLGQIALHGAQFQVGLTVDGAHRLRKLVQRRRIDHMHRKRQRHAQHHRRHRCSAAPGVVAQVLPGEGAEQCKHGLHCGRRGWSQQRLMQVNLAFCILLKWRKAAPILEPEGVNEPRVPDQAAKTFPI